MRKVSTENNFNYLFVALLTLLFSTALLQQLQEGWLTYLLDLIVFAVFVVGAYSIRIDHTFSWALYMVSSLVIAFYLLRTFLPPEAATYIQLTLMLLFFISSFLLSYRQILLVKEVNRNIMVGSIVLYLLLGLIWSMLYLLMVQLFGDAFNGVVALPWQENFSKLTYYSFVTLTTLGYGDISPKNSIAEFFVYLESITGVFYMAIIVSTLVGSHLSKSHEGALDHE